LVTPSIFTSHGFTPYGVSNGELLEHGQVASFGDPARGPEQPVVPVALAEGHDPPGKVLAVAAALSRAKRRRRFEQPFYRGPVEQSRGVTAAEQLVRAAVHSGRWHEDVTACRLEAEEVAREASAGLHGAVVVDVQAPEGVRTIEWPPVSSAARLRRLKAPNPFPSGFTSTSSTSGPGAPVAIATLAFGHFRHQARITSGLVVASLNPCSVRGALRSGRHGNTG
jgi:hypothetical protein